MIFCVLVRTRGDHIQATFEVSFIEISSERPYHFYSSTYIRDIGDLWIGKVTSSIEMVNERRSCWTARWTQLYEKLILRSIYTTGEE